MSLTLRPYQQAMCSAVVDQLGEGRNRVLLQAATGTGKTVTFASLIDWPEIVDYFDGFGAWSVLIIAHREELLDQSAAKILAINPAALVGIEQGDRRAPRASRIVIASIQTLAASKYRRLFRLMQTHTFRLVIVDEAHHAAAPTYRTVLAHLGFLPLADVSESEESEAASFEDVAVMTEALAGWDAQAPKDRVLVGVTATPNRSDDVGLACVFQSLAFSYPMREAIKDGWLARIRPYVIESDVNLDAVKMSHGDFNQKSLAEAVNREARNQLAVAAWQEKGERLPTIAFTVDVAHAHAIAGAFQAVGVRAVALSGETPKDERRGILQRFQAGQIDLIANCMVLTEGTDLPVAACLLHLKPTKSATLYEQMTGRVLRPHPEDPAGPDRLVFAGPLRKPYAVVIDVVDVTQRHSLMSAPVLQGLPPSLATDGGLFLDEVGDELDALRALYPGFDVAAALQSGRLTLEALRARAREFNIFTLPDLGHLASLVRLRWKKLTDDSYVLSYPWGNGSWTETVEASKQLIGWTVTVERQATRQERERRQSLRQPAPVAQKRVIAESLGTAVAALRAAESFVSQERRAALTIVDGKAGWRSRPATEKQIKRLESLSGAKKKHLTVPTLTSGEASDLIDLLIARKQRESKRA